MQKGTKLPKAGQVFLKVYQQQQIQLLPPSLEELIPNKHLVRVIKQLVDALAIKALERPYRGGGTTSYQPKMMLIVSIYAYCTKIYSCRLILIASKELSSSWGWLLTNGPP